jgi:hypothetical protein
MDGDPASDTLLFQDISLPYPPPTSGASNALARAVEAVYEKLQRIKVAVIATPTDLGSVPSLFGRADDYARFLGQEIKIAYSGPLLVAMSSGFGIYDAGHDTGAETAVLNQLTPAGASTEDLVRSATDAVEQLEQAKALASPDTQPPYASAGPLASIRRGRPTALAYTVLDNSGWSSVVVRVLGPHQHTLATFRIPLRRIHVSQHQTVKWSVPATLARTTIKVCVSARDPSGNRSQTSCAATRVT